MLTRKCHITLIFLCCARIPTDLSEKCEGHQAGFHCFPSLIIHAATPPLLLFLISWPSKFNIPRGHLAICWEQLVHWLHLFPLSWQKWDSWLSEEGPAWVTAEELGGSGIFPGPLSAGISLSSSSYCSMHDRLINREASCRVKEQRVYSDRRQTEKMVNLCPKDPSCLS